MGTSKGYIAPTTPHWSQAKRAVTSYINSGDGESRAKAASKYASAMHHDIATSEQFTKAAGSIAYDMTSEEKQTQEFNSLRNIPDSFKKIVIVNGSKKPWRNDEGFVIMGMKYFLLNANSLEF